MKWLMDVAQPGPEFSVHEIPFSYAGSWFNFSPVIGEKVYSDDVHLVSHQTGLHPVLRLVPVAGGVRVDTDVRATPARLTWSSRVGRIELTFSGIDTVRVRGTGLGLLMTAAEQVLTPFSGPYLFCDPSAGAYVYTLYETGRRYRVTRISGALTEVTGAQSLGPAERSLTFGGDGAPWEVAIEEVETARAPFRAEQSFDHDAAHAQAVFATFLEAVAPWRDATTPAAELAAYVLWSATVRPAGFLSRPAVLMSKHWMDKVWSWDHCFNALALAQGAPRLSWDQYQIPFDHQDAAGALPDSVAHSEVLHNFVKPPIHGWALGQLRRLITGLTTADLANAYAQLERWTMFWLDQRRAPDSDLPYYQHGNDSGWDNATAFDDQRVIEAPDLAAFLVLQLRELAHLAARLGYSSARQAWTARAEALRTAMLDQLWRVDRFAVRSPMSQRYWSTPSLLLVMPIVLGQELPEEISAVLAERIETHLTSYGLATELPTSPDYSPDGYWRGPIWAPSTVLIEDGLRRAGHIRLADDISLRFRALCEKSGFAENFDAQTGAALRDRAYTWTASSYLRLAAADRRRRRRLPEQRTGADLQVTS
jgi:hypothetical protein